MPDWTFPQISVSDNGSFSVDTVVSDDLSVDMSDVSSPDDVEVVEDAQGVVLDVSGGDVDRIHMSVDDFAKLVESSFGSSVSENDPVFDSDLMPLAVEGNDVSVSSFNPQAWQINMAENRPIGWHYVMTRTGSNSNNYILVLGRDVTYQDGLYTYQDADFYSVYQTGSSGNVRYHYDVRDHYSGTISSASYVVYSDLYFDYIGSRSVSYSWLIVVFIALIVLLLIFFRGNRN